MDAVTLVVGLAFAAAAGVAVWLAVGRAGLMGRAAAAEAGLEVAAREVEALRAEVRRREEELARLAERETALQVEVAELRAQMEGERKVASEKLAAVMQAREEIEKKLAEFESRTEKVFGALAGKALEGASEQFLKLAKESLQAQQRVAELELEKRREAVDRLVRPIAETLAKTDAKLAEIEKERLGAYSGLVEQIRGLAAAQETLRAETGKLVRALSKPEVRGRYGEIQLRRVAELAGMTAYCDFSEQASTRGADGRLQRPDMTVRLPNNRLIAVDAKTNTQAYIEACDAATDEEREECLQRFARHVAEQVAALSKKTYWAELKDSPEFVVMFVPGDQFLDAALARRPDLLEYAAEMQVILASPSTLIGLLRAVAVGWREKSVADQAAALLKLGGELRERAATLYGHMTALGKAIDASVTRYNEMIGSYEARLTPTLKRFEDAGLKGAKALPALAEVGVRPRGLTVAADNGEGGLLTRKEA